MMPLAQTLFAADVLVAAGNAALGASITCANALVLSGRVLQGLPARHALLTASLAAGVMIPAVAPLLPPHVLPPTGLAKPPLLETRAREVKQPLVDAVSRETLDLAAPTMRVSSLPDEPSRLVHQPPPPTVAGHIPTATY